MGTEYLRIEDCGGVIIAPDWAAIARLMGKLAKAAGAMGGVERDGRNKDQGYSYVSYEEAAVVIRRALSEIGIAMTLHQREMTISQGQTASGKAKTIVNMTLDVTFADGETGAMKIVQAHGQGEDMQDKAIPKALTAAVKYGLMRCFLLSTREDIDADAGEGDGHKAEAPPVKAETAAPAQSAPPAEHWIKDEKTRTRFWVWANTELALSNDQVHQALGVAHVEEFTGTAGDAKSKILAWAKAHAEANAAKVAQAAAQ